MVTGTARHARIVEVLAAQTQALWQQMAALRPQDAAAERWTASVEASGLRIVTAFDPEGKFDFSDAPPAGEKHVVARSPTPASPKNVSPLA